MGSYADNQDLDVDKGSLKLNTYMLIFIIGCVGANIPGKTRALLTSPDSAPVMRAKRVEVAANSDEGFLLQ